VSAKVVRHMVSALAHRGPDNEGWWAEGNCGLGHRRLAVIDPTPAGNQPMFSRDKHLVLVYNGTVYNFPQLKVELEKLGYEFASNCDTEVLVHGWREWGKALVPRLNGHFAFVMWDKQRQRLYLVRDRFGAKPLYFAHLGGLWLFASEIKAILNHPEYTPGINFDALYEYFTFQNLFRHHTIFKDVNLVPQANVLEIDAATGRWDRNSYWDYDFSSPDETMEFCEAKEETARLMAQATKRQLISDVPVGAYLSGGMDSGTVVSISSMEIPRLATFTCGWHMGDVKGVEASFDERIQAEALSFSFGTEHFEQVVGHTDVPWAMPDVVEHLEELRLGMSYGQYYISRLASKFVKVCLTGTGGDELFGGYPWRYYRVSRSLGHEEFFSEYYAYWQRLVPDEERAAFFTPGAMHQINDFNMKQVLKRVFTFDPDLKFDRPEDHIANSLYFECKTFLHGLLIVADRLSMAHGLEERHPFLDNDLVEFAQKIPVRHKLQNLGEWKRQDENILGKSRAYYAQHNDGKNVLRKAMERFLPREVIDRRKQGFSSPDESWYRGPNVEYIRRLLLDKSALCHEFISAQAIERTIDRHCRGGANMRLLIWSLLCFELWLKIFMEQRQVNMEETAASHAA
jgi:asparagine synthase (glutamine-hydrolysing)